MVYDPHPARGPDGRFFMIFSLPHKFARTISDSFQSCQNELLGAGPAEFSPKITFPKIT
jgi:hypothetical protein